MPTVPLRRLALVTSAVVLAGVPLGTPAQAADHVPFRLEPAGTAPYPKFDARAGQTVRGAIRLKSRSDRELTIRLQALDLSTADTGGIEFTPGRPDRTGAWLRLERRDVRLAPRSTVAIGFSARVPGGAAAGEHFGGIVAIDRAELRRAASRRRSAGSGVEVRELTRLALPVRVRLPGRATRRLDVRGAAFAADAGGSRLDLGLASTGGLLVRDTALDLRVVRDGRTLFTHRADVSDFVPGTRIAYPIAWRGRPARGDYRVVGTIRPRGGAAVRVDETVAFRTPQAGRLEQQTGVATPGSDLPVVLIGALAGAVLLAGAASVGYLRLRRRLAAATAV